MLQPGVSGLSSGEAEEENGGFQEKEWQEDEACEEVDHFAEGSVGIPTDLDTFILTEPGLGGHHHISYYLLGKKVVSIHKEKKIVR